MVSAVLLLAALAFADEQLTFTARWMGVTAGRAIATTVVQGDVREVTVTAKNATWLDGLYPIDDRMVSEGRSAGGSIRYQTWFREGRFTQDQDMLFSPTGQHVDRRQLVDGAWKASTSDRTNSDGQLPEDPISAFYRIREAGLKVGERLLLDVYNGKRVVPVVVDCVRRQALGDIEVRFVSIRSGRDGDFDGGIDLFLTDADVPALAVLPTRAGPVRIEVE
ncbi:MAG: DUF3108 domain-containing protein [Myxococcales bacterium]|nr:DUF3108 domain-containing protein [Myxococcales bacterium]